MILIQLILGFVFLFIGAEILLRGAVALAQRFGISSLLIGMTVVAFGTSLPEMIASIQAALTGVPGVAMGNVVGSNIANVMLLMGLMALIAPIHAKPQELKPDAVLVLLATAILVLIAQFDSNSRIEGTMMVALLIGQTIWRYRSEQQKPEPAPQGEEVHPVSQNSLLNIALVIGGLIAMGFGAKYLVDGAVALARLWGVSESIIGLTLVAVGTSLPELATCIVAAYRKHSDVMIGNIIGSNIFNILSVLGVTLMVKPFTLKSLALNADLAVMTGSTVLLLVLLFWQKGLGRVGGAVFFGGYILYNLHKFGFVALPGI